MEKIKISTTYKENPIEVNSLDNGKFEIWFGYCKFEMTFDEWVKFSEYIEDSMRLCNSHKEKLNTLAQSLE